MGTEFKKASHVVAGKQKIRLFQDLKICIYIYR